jgi:hypothetical protein
MGRMIAIIALACAMGVLVITPARAADDNPLAAGGNVQDALARVGAGKEVELVLANGKSYRGKLGTVSAQSVVVTEVAGKEYYDVLIDLEDVSAIELRVRGNR